MYWHIDADIIALVVICALYIYDLRLLPLKEQNDFQDRRFSRCLLAGIVVAFIDIAASVIMEVPASPILYQALMMLNFISTEGIMLLWFAYAVSILYGADKRLSKRIIFFSSIPFCAYSLAVLSNPWTGLFFTLGENNEYTRGPLFFLMVAVYALYALMTFVLIIAGRKRLPPGYPVAVLLLTPVILAIAIPLQLLNNGWLMIVPAYMVCLVLAFLNYEVRRKKSDRETMSRLRDLVEHFDAGFMICSINPDRVTKIDYVNDVFCQMCELDRETFLQRHRTDPSLGIHPEDRERWLDKSRRLAEEFEGYEITFRFITDSGKIKHLLTKTNVVKHADGSASGYATFTDITDQINLQQQLSDIIRNIPCGICMFQWDGKRLIPKLVNERFSEQLGEDAQAYLDSVVGFNYSHVHPDDLERLERESLKALNETRAIDITYRSMNMTTNQYLWIRMRGILLPQADGTQNVFASFNDVTQEHMTEQIIRAQYELEKNKPSIMAEKLLVHALVNLSTGEFMDYRYADGSEVPSNDRTAFEGGSENLERTIIDEEEREQYKALHNSEYLLGCFENGETEFSMDYRRLVPSGEVIWVRDILHLLRSPNGSDVLLFEYWYNIEDERMLEEMYRSIASENYDFVARINGKTRAFTVVPRAGLNYHMPPLKGEDSDDVALSIYEEDALPEDREMARHNSLLEVMKKNIRERGRFQFIYRVADKDEEGAVRYKRVTQYYIDPQREIIIMTREDVTELIRAEIAKNDILAAALESANQASEAKSSFLSRVSHELRTPLNAIIGFIELARDAQPQQLEDYIANSDLAAKQLLSIINDVLDMSSIEAGKLKLAYAPFDLREVVEFVDNIYAAQCEQKGVSFHTRLEFNLDKWLLGDRMRVTQILMNLLNNAVKFTKEGAVALKVSLTESRGSAAFIRFEVSDTGCGISEEMQKRLFNPFEQESASTAQRYGGSGLGLSIVRSLVSMMSGHIGVESREGEGSTFTVDLPFELCEASHPDTPTEAAGAGTSETENLAAWTRDAFKGRRILLAEDNPLNRMVAEGLVERLGAMCDSAEDGEGALKKFLASESGYYDAVLMDIQMPNMDGFEATRAIRRSDHPDAKSIYIIAQTANAFNEDIAKTLSGGMNAHVAKPIEPAILAEALTRAFKSD